MAVRIAECRSPGTWRDFTRFVDEMTSARLEFGMLGRNALSSHYNLHRASQGRVWATQSGVEHQHDWARRKERQGFELVLQVEAGFVSIKCDRLGQVRHTERDK